MSYILENNNPLISTKLTDNGRRKIAQGSLTYSFWALGDSELDYRYQNSIPEELGNEAVLKPKDFNPFLKTILEKDQCVKLHPLTIADKEIIECCYNNEATKRGFFSGDTLETFQTKVSNNFNVNTGTVNLTQFAGSKFIDLQTSDFRDGDYILFKISKPETGQIQVTDVQTPVLHLWYKISKTPSSTIVELDRNLPNFAYSFPDVKVPFIIYPKGDSITEFYGSGTTEGYWNSETLEFVSDCDLTTTDVPVWNMNLVWNEDLIGIQNGYETHENFGSIDFVGQKEYLGYNTECPEVFVETNDCEDRFLSEYDNFIKGVGVFHYTNNNISNDYGEMFYIDNDNKPFEVYLPTLMWHRRYFGGSTLGDEMGMRFVSSGSLKKVEDSEIEYYELVEDPNYINPTGTSMSVGRVFPKLKIFTIHDEEILATLSYKSNRNFTLPRIDGRLVFPTNGLGTGLIPKGKTLYVTYTLESDSGQRYILPQQKYTKFVNRTNIDRDVEFTIEDIGLLPYMRKLEDSSYDGLGFFANRFKVLCQLVDNSSDSSDRPDRPDPTKWVAIDYTDTSITDNISETINPYIFELQNPNFTGFLLHMPKYNSGYIYDLSVLEIAEVGCPEDLQFGDERFFYGNVFTNIGACAYKTVFNLKIDSNDFKKTDNPTWTNETLAFSEVGIYDQDQELVAISKISNPQTLDVDTKFGIEISLDF